MQELVDVVKTLKPDGFEPKIIQQTPDFLYVEYSSPIFGVRGAARAALAGACWSLLDLAEAHRCLNTHTHARTYARTHTLTRAPRAVHRRRGVLAAPGGGVAR